MTPEDDEDDLLHDLGRLARERAREGRQSDEWDRLTEGALTPAEEAALAARAASDPEAAAALAAFRPLDEAFEERLVGAIQEQRVREKAGAKAGAVGSEAAANDAAGSDHAPGDRGMKAAREPETPAPGTAGTVTDARAGAEQESSRLSAPAAPVQSVSPRRSRWRPSRAWGSGLAAAAVLAGILVTRPGAPLPVYRGEIRGGEHKDRSAADTAPPVYSAGSKLELVLRPASAIHGPVEVRCKIACVLRGATRSAAAPRDWPPCASAKADAEGSIRISGTIGRDIALQEGDCDLWALIVRSSYAGPLARFARPGLPGDEALLRLAPGASRHGRGWSALHLSEPLRFAAAR